MQINPNSQAPIGSPETTNAPRLSKKERKVAPKKSRVNEGEIVDIDPTARQVADGASSAVLESTDLERVVRRLRSGAYNTREVADVIARRLLASGDL